MSDAELLTTLAALGVHLRLEGDRLRVNAPKGVLTPELQTQLAARKPALVALLSQAQTPVLPPLTARNTDEPRPLALGQERLWRLAQLTPGAGLYNMYLAFRIEGPLEVTRLEHSLARLVERHATLRTNIREVAGEPRQFVRPFTGWQLPIVDLAGAADPHIQTTAFIDREIRHAFDPTHAPLFRATLLRLAEDAHVLSLAQHHLISDGWSWEVLLSELAAGYAGAALPEMAIQFGDYAEWQRGLWSSAALEPQLAYWRKQLAGVPVDLALPFDAPGRTPSTHGARQSVALSPEHTSAVKAFSRAAGQTLFTTLATAFGAALHQHTGQASVVFGAPVAGREQPEAKGLIGYLNNVVLLRIEAGGDPTLRALAGRMRATVTEALAHQDVPLHKVLEQPGLDRLNVRRALFSLNDGTGHTLQLPGLTITPLEAYNETATFDLSLTAQDRGAQLTLTVEYARDLFQPQTIALFLRDVCALIEHLGSRPDLRLSELPQRRRAAIAPREPRPFVAPQTPTEIKCAAAWSAVLGVAPISRYDDFFAIGGTSLKVLQVVERLERDLQRRIPLASLLQASTLDALAALIDRGAGSARESALIPIQPQGRLRPLFAVHHGGGGIFEFANVARYLGDDQPVYGLQEPGFEAGEGRLDSIEALAAHYLRAIRSVQPQGPYALAGFCFGGVVAYEMAQQLRREGQATEALFLIDAISPGYGSGPTPLTERVQRHSGRMARLSPAEKAAYLLRRVIKRLRWEVQRRVIDLQDWYRRAAFRAYRAAGRTEPAFLRQYALMQYNGELLTRYRAQPYDARAVLIRSNQDDLTLDYGWNALVKGGVTIRQMPTADHLEMMIEPNVAQLVEHLQQILSSPAATTSHNGGVHSPEKEMIA